MATVAMRREIDAISVEALSSFLRRVIAQTDADYEQREIVD